MNFKLFEDKDLPNCTKTFMDVFNQEPWNDEWTLDNAKQYLLDFSCTPGFKGILAVERDEILGFIFGVHRVWWSGDEFFINEMCVRADLQNKGIGKALLNQLSKEISSSPITNISLLTDRGIPAEEFYKKNGFKEIERLVFLSKGI
ncbi:GNAT family N-acetyltransferase [Fictibacillus fluitans]|uniref:GNAT family N-acetyltransferase n=1 Tax=Fictibacillus fluitans TaxID=3058422 RepID=A0ABT8HTK8_9BACL|nr:GNAT family N-acetyltransferase [Fictibacillus sp. NE201]MDN4524096.1 GNAT family N-acetyltransferase [Fictibacillus sp. NE201]